MNNGARKIPRFSTCCDQQIPTFQPDYQKICLPHTLEQAYMANK